MRKGRRKMILAAILAAALSMTSVVPAFAEASTVTETETTETPSVEIKEGWNTIDGKKYYVKDGVKQKGWLKYKNYSYYLNPSDNGAAATGITKIKTKYYYFTSSGKLVKSKYAYKINNKYYEVSSKGVLKRLYNVEGMAGERLQKLNGSLYEAFKWSANIKYRDMKVPAGKKPAPYYGEYGFKYGQGDCNVQAYTFYWMAKRLGYDVSYVKGYVAQRNGKYGAHAWCELKIKGKIYVCDPNMASQFHKQYGYKFAYRFTYGTKGTYQYCDRYKRPIRKK